MGIEATGAEPDGLAVHRLNHSATSSLTEQVKPFFEIDNLCPKAAQNATTRMGFEPTRAEPDGLAVHRLNHSATSSHIRKS